jgi:hypothetical protein
MKYLRVSWKWGGLGKEEYDFIYRRPTLYPLEIAVDFLKSL